MDGLEVERVLQSRLVTVPGGRDKEGRPLLVITPPQDLPSSQPVLAKALSYTLSIYNGETRNNGVSVIVDAQGRSWRQTRSFVRHLGETLKDETTSLIVVRPEAFWDKRVDHCTRLHSNKEPLYIPLSRLSKYVESSQLPQDLGGSLEYDHERWIQGRLRVERFFKMNTEVQSELERVCRILTGAREGTNNAARTMTQTSATYNNTCQLANLLISDGRNLLESYGVERIADNIGQDVLDTRSRVEKQLNLASSRRTALHQAWFAMHKSISDAKEVSRLEAGIRGVTDWILETGEVMMNSQSHVGYDISSAEQLRREHEGIEMHCRETYGQYAETLHQLEQSATGGVAIPEDLKAQRDFMDFVCRSFANRLQRRRNTLISSARFFRLVSEYFHATSEVYEKLVMNPDLEKLDAAQSTLLQLQESQSNVDELEEAVVREGEKLSDLLSMPVKDALGKELLVDYEADIVNIRDILEMTRARTELFRDSMELQKITLQQASHVFSYEKDAAQAIVWLNDLFKVMLKANFYVGCTVQEIQRQKEDLQAFQDTAKGTFEYGCQLLNAAMSLRQNSKLGEGENSELSLQLSEAWDRFSNIAHNQMTRLRVTAVLHRTLKQQCKELKELTSTAHSVRGAQLRRLLRSRERLLIDVARMLRLARLLKTRLKESLFKEAEERMSNRSAVDAISERVAEVIALAEQLDEVLISFHQSELSQAKFSRELDSSPSPDRISPPPLFTTQQEWLRDKDDACRSEEEFQTASECTCTPPSRSSSFYTASDGGSPWWPITQHSQLVEGEVVQEIKETKTIKLSPEGCSIVSERTCREHQRERTVSPRIESPSGSEREHSVRLLNGTPEPWRTGVFDVDVEPWGRRTPRSDGLKVLEVEEWTKSQEELDWRGSSGPLWDAGCSSSSEREEPGTRWRKIEIQSSNDETPSSNDEIPSSLEETPSSKGELRPNQKSPGLRIPKTPEVRQPPPPMFNSEPTPSTSTAETIRKASDSPKGVNKRTLAGMLDFLPSAILKHNLTNIQGKMHMS